jgi:hypothetical protein
MGQQELLLTLGAIVAFSIASFAINQNMGRNSEAIYATQAEFYAVSLAQRFIEEAKSKAFEQDTITGTVDDEEDLADPDDLSPGGGETYNDFNDVDDYNGYTTTVNTSIGPMSVSITVFYVDEADLNTDTNDERYFKKMTVTVQSAYLNAPVRADYVFSFQRNP